jgi:hypothetical protein
LAFTEIFTKFDASVLFLGSILFLPAGNCPAVKFLGYYGFTHWVHPDYEQAKGIINSLFTADNTLAFIVAF